MIMIKINYSMSSFFAGLCLWTMCRSLYLPTVANYVVVREASLDDALPIFVK